MAGTRKPHLPLIRGLLRENRGAIDLTSIIVGVIIVGIVSTVISAIVFKAIPWAQDQATQTGLAQLRIAQEVANTRDGQYQSVSQLTANGYLTANAAVPNISDEPPGVQLVSSQTPVRAMAAGSSSTAGGALQVVLGSDGGCYVASQQSLTGKTYYVSSTQNSVSQVTTTLPDTTSCAPFPQPIGSATATVGSVSSTLVEKSTQNSSWAAQNSRTDSFSFSNALSESIQATLACPVATTGSGSLQYSVDGGSSWVSMKTVTASNALQTLTGTLALTAMPTGLQFQTVVNCKGTAGPWSTSATSTPWSQPLITGFTPMSIASSSSAKTSTATVVSNPACTAGTLSGGVSHQHTWDTAFNQGTLTGPGSFKADAWSAAGQVDSGVITTTMSCAGTSGVSTTYTGKVYFDKSAEQWTTVRTYG